MNGERSTANEVDAGLIVRFLAGDHTAFDQLFARHQDYVYNIVYGIVGSPEEARDIAQEVFLQVYRSLGSFRRGSRFATWLYRVAVNRAVDSARQSKNRRWMPFDESVRAIPDPKETPAQAAEKRAGQEAVQAILMQVPLQHRDILVLRYYQDLSVEEIADVLHCSIAAAKVRLHRARQQFKDRYIAAYGTGNGQEHETLPSLI